MPPSPNDLLARNLRALRLARGWSQEKMAERCGLHRTYVGAIERGERGGFTRKLAATGANRLTSIWRATERPPSSGCSPCGLEYNLGFAPNEQNKISALVQEHQAELLKAWHGYFKSGNGSRGGQAR